MEQLNIAMASMPADTKLMADSAANVALIVLPQNLLMSYILQFKHFSLK